MTWRSVVVIGLDGFDPLIAEAMIERGELPHLDGIRRRGGYSRVATTMPAQTPVAWSTFAVGANPGAHGTFDFLRRDPLTYRPEIGLFRHEQKSRFLPPKAVNLRGGTPVWEHLSDAGISSTILRHPCTYPPKTFHGRALAGVGVPDLRGGFGSSSFYTSDPEITSGEGEHVFRVVPDASGRATAELHGPILPDGGDLRVDLEIEADAGPGSIRIRSPQGGFDVPLEQGRWSPWVHVRFKHGLLQTVRGLVRFHVANVFPLALFVSAIHFDPDAPLFPVSHPWDYAGELRRALGPFATLGMAEEHNGLINRRMDEGAFLSQCLDVMDERRAMMHFELDRHDEGLFFCLFDTPDRVQHMFWRFREPAHPANRGEPFDPDMSSVIEEHYRRCDEIVGEALSRAGDDALVMVLSDHGFASFQREVNLNAWLHQHGYLALRNGEEPLPGAGNLLKQVDWGRTRAYALGMAGLYLNLAGREAEGTVSASDSGPLAEEIASRLKRLRDPVREEMPVAVAISREKIYRGAYRDDAPDLLVGYARGYRVASSAAMGGVGPDIIIDNRRSWSGDHVVDPGLVPGVLFMMTPFRIEGARLMDLAPTILEALGVPPGPELEGASLFPGRSS